MTTRAATNQGASKRFAAALLMLLAILSSAFRAAGSGATSDPAAYERAVQLAQRGQEAASAELLRPLASTPNVNLARRARMLLMSDERAMFDYRAALEAIEPLTKTPDSEIANRERLLKSLIGVPRETVEHRVAISLWSPLVTARIGAKKVQVLIDTGASLSVLSRSAAIASGLRIRPVNYEIKSADGQMLHADVAVGDITIADTRIRNVVFLVLPDARLRRTVPCFGVIGLPVLRLLGPLIFQGASRSPPRGDSPVTLVQGNVAIDATVQGRRLQCLLDTGSNRSWVSSSSGVNIRDLADIRRHLVSRTAAGNEHLIPAYEAQLEFSLGGRSAVLNRVLVMPPARRAANGPSCTFGADAIAALAPVALDLYRMRMVLF